MRVIDFKGLKCPIPVLKAFKIVKEEKEINEFTFLTDDASAPKDFKDFCINTGLILISISKKNDHHEILIKRPNSEK
ncbi:sulfurtransferase TusA family protein [Alphaproteobacteria bacterium]|nr:sulfurtransferase TusA family protein [Alphaproteobacteria bacterium]